ncbi:MAG TPA: glycosyltransferase [Pyrinomonadaceae bacterium]|nr:glycosyltransferase [Pyrinomonadaceae bacterium]
MKDWTYARSRLTVVAPSRWIEGLAKESPLLGRFPVRFIPNGLDARVFRPAPKEEARAGLGLDPTRRVVLFSAHSVLDRRKGGALMQEALARLSAAGASNVPLLVLGAGAEEWEAGPGLEVVRLKSLEDDERLALVYSAADVFVLPTLAENLPNGVIESMACATPPVTFDVGGCPDAVRHLETGYLARYKDAEDLARGIRLLLEDEELRRRLARRGREVVEAEYTSELQAARFFALYEEVTAGSAAPARSSPR